MKKPMTDEQAREIADIAVAMEMAERKAREAAWDSDIRTWIDQMQEHMLNRDRLTRCIESTLGLTKRSLVKEDISDRIYAELDQWSSSLKNGFSDETHIDTMRELLVD